MLSLAQSAAETSGRFRAWPFGSTPMIADPARLRALARFGRGVADVAELVLQVNRLATLATPGTPTRLLDPPPVDCFAGIAETALVGLTSTRSAFRSLEQDGVAVEHRVHDAVLHAHEHDGEPDAGGEQREPHPVVGEVSPGQGNRVWSRHGSESESGVGSRVSRESGVGRDQEGRRYSPCPRRLFLLPPGS